MIPSTLEVNELDADLFLSTHLHADHLIPNALPAVAKNKKTFFIGSPDCEGVYKQNNLSNYKYITLKEGEELKTKGIRIKTFFADHGDLTPDVVGSRSKYVGLKYIILAKHVFPRIKLKPL